MGKLLCLIIMGVLGYQNQVMFVNKLQTLKDASSIIQTYMEINSYKGKLSEYSGEHEGRLPENIGAWLNDNFKSSGKSEAGFDYFGTPYQLMVDADTSRELLMSCGPDKECGTSDDIELKM